MTVLSSDEPEDEAPAAVAGPNDVARVDRRVLELLVCPMTRTPLAFRAAKSVLVSVRPKVAYDIVNGVPIMIPAEARELDDGDPLLRG